MMEKVAVAVIPPLGSGTNRQIQSRSTKSEKSRAEQNTRAKGDRTMGVGCLTSGQLQISIC
jgi:hypothetical protein